MTAIDYYVAQSLDGCIATQDEDLTWLLETRFGPEGHERGYGEFFAGIGALAMGSATYEWVLNEMDEWAYADTPTFVLTRRTGLPVPDGADVRFTSDPIPAVAQALREAAGDKDAWLVGGGDVAAQFVAAGELDRLSLCIVPTWLGGGRPTFAGALDVPLTFLRAEVYPTGPVFLRYAVAGG